MIYIKLFYEFFKTGLFAIGGGMATVPFLYNMSDSTAWFSHSELADMIAVGESTPGPIGVNMATYVGYVVGLRNYGYVGALLGALCATLGLVAPSVIVVMIVAKLLAMFGSSKCVSNAFYGLRPASVGLIAAAGASVAIANLFDLNMIKKDGILGAVSFRGILLAVVLWCLSNVIPQTKKLHPIVYIVFSAVVGILFSMGK